jgi:hypothetical protein
VNAVSDHTPPKLAGKEFEELILHRARQLEADGVLTLSRYGVQGSMRDGKWMPIQSYPDFDGTIAPDGTELICEAKAVTGTRVQFDDSHAKTKQIEHMLRRSRFGAKCFLLIHWNRRVLKTRTDEAITHAVPVTHDCPFWDGYLRGEEKSISRHQADLYGLVLPWYPYSERGRKATPAIEMMTGRLLATK